MNTTIASTGSGASNSWAVTIPAPANGNTLVAAISIRASTASPGVTSITQSGATWVQAVYSPNPGGTVTEIWYATNVFNAGSTVTINTTFAWRQAAVVTEYSGINAINPLDVSATSTGTNTTSASTGTTATTSQTNELWFGAIGLTNSSPTLGTPSNGFGVIGVANSTNAISANNAKVYALEKIATTTGTAASGGTLSAAVNWSGLMVTLKGIPTLTTNQIATLLAPFSGVHPRLMMNSAQLTALRARTNNPSYSNYWNKLVVYAKAKAASTPPAYDINADQRLFGDYIHGMAFAYLISGDTNILAGAVNWATNICNYPSWNRLNVSGMSVPYGLEYGHWLVGLAALYDYAYNDLDPSVRGLIFTNLVKHGGEQYQAFVNGDVDPIYLSNQWWVQGSGVLAAGLMTFDQPGSSNVWSRIALMQNGFTSAASIISPDGWHQEGAGYWQYGGPFLLQAFEWSRQMLGVDYFAATASGWGANAGTFTFDFMIPRNSWAWYDGISSAAVVPFEDAKLDNPAPANLLRGVGHFFGDGYAQWFADQLEKVPNLNEVEPSWSQFYWYDGSVASIVPTNLPTCHVFTNTAIVSSRTDWSGNESLLTFKCGGPVGNLVATQYASFFNNLNTDPGAGHTHPDAASFCFFGGGEWLISEPAYFKRSTFFENTLIIDGTKGQYGDTPTGSPNYLPLTNVIPYLTQVSSTPSLDVMIGEAAPAYASSAGVQSFQRHILFAKPDVLVVADRVQMNNTSHTTDLYFHSLNTNTFVKQGDGSLVTTTPFTTSRFDLLTTNVSTMTNFLQNITARHTDGPSNIMTLVKCSTSGRTNWQNVMVFSWTTNGGTPAKATLLFTNGSDWIYRIGTHIVDLNWSNMPPASPVVMSADEIRSYGASSTISATVSGGVGTMQFYVDGTNFGTPVTLSSGFAALPSTATLPTGRHPVMGIYSNTTTHLLATAADEALLTITPIQVGVSGTRAYDGTTNVDTGILAFTGNLDGANLSLSGSGYLTNGNVGTQQLFTGSKSPARVNFATGGSTVNGTPAASWNVVVPPPENGNTLIAAINVHGSGHPAVTSISQAGANWVRAAYSENPGFCQTEIWYTTNLVNAGTNVTITTSAAWRSAAVVVEYRGLATINALDVTASSTNSGSAASTGTTTTTSQANELWFGCIGLSSSAYTLNTISNGFSLVTSAESENSTAGNNGDINVVEKFATSAGNAGCSASVGFGWMETLVSGIGSWNGAWSGIMATFKVANTNSPLALAGPASGNYIISVNPGTVLITNQTPHGLAINITSVNVEMTAVGNPTTISFMGNPAIPYVTQRSTNMVTWVNISTNTAEMGIPVNVLDTFADIGGLPPKTAFYRVKSADQ